MQQKQLITFVFDNSSCCEREKLAALMNGFRRFAEEQKNDATLEFELICYDVFAPAVVKPFESDAIAPVRAGRVPLLGRAALCAADRIGARVAALKEAGVGCYRPLLVLLSAGFTLDESDEAVIRLEAMEKAGELSYLPFKLSPKLLTDRLQSLDRTKHMIEIKQDGIDGFFAFISRIPERRRAAQSADGGLKFQKSDFEGWAEL